MADGPIYLDYNATTPLDPRVLEAMAPWFLTPSNAGSRTHVYGQFAKEAVERGRAQVARVLGVPSEDIVFTSGATESNNIAILGLAKFGIENDRRHIVSTTIEHKAVLEPLQRMQNLGFDVELVSPTKGGFVEPEAIKERLRDDTLLLSVMHANNETGVMQPLVEIGELLRGTKILFHTDAAQTFGKEVDLLRSAGADLISVSAHKVYGPKGIGALYVKRSASVRRQITPITIGGGQERGLRSGTLPVELVVGFGVASELALSEHAGRQAYAASIKKKLIDALQPTDHRINGDQERTQSHVLNVSFDGVDSEALMMACKEFIAVSNGSACTSNSYSASHVLLAMGIEEEAATEAIRISWGPSTQIIPTDRLLKSICELKVTV